MEELERKFEYANDGSRRQIAFRLYNTLLAKKSFMKLHEPIDHTTQHQILELQVLWSKCSSSFPTVADVCSKLLVKLVEDGQADLDYVISNFLSLILPHPVSPPAALVHAVGCLYRMQILGLLTHFGMDDGFKKCRQLYKLRSSLHPLSQILYTDTENWPLLLNEVVFILSHPTIDTRSENGQLKWQVFYETLLPFIKCVYLDPAMGPSCYQLRAALFNEIFNSCTTCSTLQQISRDNPLLVRLIKTWQEIVSCLDVSSGPSLQEALQHLSDISRKLVVHAEPDWHQELSLIVMQLLCVCHTMLKVGLNTRLALLELKTIISALASVDDVAIVALSNLLLLSPMFGTSLGPLIDLVPLVLDKCSPPPLTLNMLVLPILKIITALSMVQDASNRTILQTANSLLARITSAGEGEERPTACQTHSRDISPLDHNWYCVMETCQALTHLMGTNPDIASHWLSSVGTNLSAKHGSQVPDWLLQLVSALLCLTDFSTALTSSALAVLVRVAQTDDTKGPDLLPLLLYKLHHEDRSQVRFELLECLPGVATHRLHVVPVLRTLQLLASSPDMYPMALRLVTSLWSTQDRCFPQLQKLLNSNPTASTKEQVYQFHLAKAASVRDICITRPSQHGEDLVAMLSAMLSEYSEGGEEGPAMALVLDGLHALFQAGVLDLLTTWQALAHLLQNESRIHPLVKICKILSLVPELHVETDEYEKFRSGSISLLWCHTGHPSSIVANAAFSALTNFGQEEFRPSLLKSSRWSPIIKNIGSSLATDLGDAVGRASGNGNQSQETSLSGDMYIKILQEVPQASLSGFEELLTALICEEVEDLPRGIAYSVTKQSHRDKKSPTLSTDIPATLLSLYENNKQPALKPGLASGLLLSHNPAAEVGKDGKPTRRGLLKFGRNFLQMMNSLISEVVFDPKDWRRNILMPQAFEQFMINLYSAVLQCNLVELEIQREQAGTLQDFEDKKSNCWLWTFEKICGQLKSAFGRGSSSVQANIIMALVGLAVAVYRHQSHLKVETARGPRQQPNSWLKLITDTLLHAAFPGYKPDGKTLFACSLRNAALTIASLCSISRLFPLTLEEPQWAGEVLDLFLGEPSQPLPGDDPSLTLSSMYSAIGLGATVAALYQNHYDLTANPQEVGKLDRARECLEKKCRSHVETLNSGGDPGGVVGFGLVLSALCNHPSADLQTYVKENLNWLLDHLKKNLGKKGAQVLCFSLSCVSVVAYSGHLISTEEIEKVTQSVNQLNHKNPQSTILLQCKGIMLNGLFNSGKGDWSRAFNQCFEELMELLNSEDDRLAALYGIAALVGSERHWLNASGNNISGSMDHIDPHLNKITSTLIQILHSSGCDFSWQNHVAWSLGYFYHVASTMNSGTSSTNLPSDYSYLPKESLLCAMVNHLQEVIGCGAWTLAEKCLSTILASLANAAYAVTFPPLNWMSLLGPLQKQGHGEIVEESYLKLILRQCLHSTGGLPLLQAMIQPHTFFKEGSRKLLLSSLPYLIKSRLPTTLLKEFIDWNCSQILVTNSKNSASLAGSLITGIRRSLETPNLSSPVVSTLCQSLERISTHFEDVLEKAGHLNALMDFSESISLLPDLYQDQLTQNSGIMGMLVRCYLVGCGRQPLNWLNDSIEVMARQGPLDLRTRSRLLATLAVTLSSLNLEPNTSASSMSRLQWLLELMGHIRSLLGKKGGQTNIELLLAVFVVGVTAFSTNWSFELLGVSTTWNQESKGEGESKLPQPPTLGNMAEFPLLQLVNALPVSLFALLSKSPWNQAIEKVLIWLMIMCEELNFSNSVSNFYRKGLQESLFALRHSKEFRKQRIWRRVFSLEYYK